MNIKVREVYYVNEAKKEVGCILKIESSHYFTWIFNVLKSIWRDGNPDDNISFKDEFNFDSKFKFPAEIRGVAKCHPNDDWDLSEGRRVARKKAYDKLAVWRKKFEIKIQNIAFAIYSDFSTEKLNTNINENIDD